MLFHCTMWGFEDQDIVPLKTVKFTHNTLSLIWKCLFISRLCWFYLNLFLTRGKGNEKKKKGWNNFALVSCCWGRFSWWNLLQGVFCKYVEGSVKVYLMISTFSNNMGFVRGHYGTTLQQNNWNSIYAIRVTIPTLLKFPILRF